MKALIARVIEAAHRKRRVVGLCGEAPSNDPAFAAWLAELGIDSISLNPDALPKVARLLAAPRPHPHGGDLVFGATRLRVGLRARQAVRVGLGKVEGEEQRARRDARVDPQAARDRAPAALDGHVAALAQVLARGVVRVHHEEVFADQQQVRSAPRHAADVVVLEDPARDERVREAGHVVLGARDELDRHQPRLAAREALAVQAARARVIRRGTWPLQPVARAGARGSRRRTGAGATRAISSMTCAGVGRPQPAPSAAATSRAIS